VNKHDLREEALPPLKATVFGRTAARACVARQVALERAVRVPIRFLGTGEGLDDLEVFDAPSYARRLVSG